MKTKDRPILFSAPMVRALLDGSKTQTRRVVKPQPPNVADGACWIEINGMPAWQWVANGDEQDIIASAKTFVCPYGQPGDRLWVRETHFAFGRWETRFNDKKGRDEWSFVDITQECGRQYSYPATGPRGVAHKRDSGITPTWWERPSIFMPRAASRITLEITGVRVKRLQDISDSDALAEGIDAGESLPMGCTKDAGRAAYSALWESINGPDSWAANPWVWVIEFKKASQ